MRTDLTEAQIRELVRRSDRCSQKIAAGFCLDAWTPADASNLRRLVGELQRLRDQQACVMHMHEIEGAY